MIDWCSYFLGNHELSFRSDLKSYAYSNGRNYKEPFIYNQ